MVLKHNDIGVFIAKKSSATATSKSQVTTEELKKDSKEIVDTADGQDEMEQGGAGTILDDGGAAGDNIDIVSPKSTGTSVLSLMCLFNQNCSFPSISFR